MGARLKESYQVQRIVLAFSGDEQSPAALRDLIRAGAEVVTLTVDVGQADELAAVRDRALASGAVRAHVVDARDLFAGSYLWTAVRAGVPAVARHSAGLVLPVVAARLVEIARIERASTVAHEYAGADAAAMDALIRACDGGISVVAPRRSDARGAAVSTLWSRTLPTDTHTFVLTRDPTECPESPASLAVEFREGLPSATNGIEMPLVELIQSVETIAGAHGVGRLPADAQHPAVEAPAAVVLDLAFRACERAALDAGALRARRLHGIDLAGIITSGGWFTPARGAIDALTMPLQRSISGTVGVRLLRGVAVVTDVRLETSEAALLPGIH